MISLEAVTRYYGSGSGRHEALKKVTLQIPEGEFIAIVGTSGSGKTTLLNIVGGLDRSYDGVVTIDGRVLSQLSDGEVSRLRSDRFGFVFQHFNLLDHLSSLENVMLPGYFGGVGQDSARAEEVLRTVGLADKIDALPTALSGGQKQRVAIARALYNRPKIILCDEPTGSLDRKTGLQIMDLFQRLNVSENITLVVITHEEHVSMMASRIVRLEDGSVVSDESTEGEPEEDA
jgi:ABC-type lipoprotein export system ATPase subunit